MVCGMMGHSVVPIRARVAISYGFFDVLWAVIVNARTA